MYADPHLSDTTRLFSTKEQRFPQISFRERHGGIAQLGERMTGSHEVSGSIPLISTKDPLCRNAERIFFSFSADGNVASAAYPCGGWGFAAHCM